MSARIIPLSNVKAQIALELAAGLIDESDIEQRFGIQREDWEIIKASPYFRRMIEDAADKISGADNTPKRIRLKAQVALEDSLPTIYGMIHNTEAPHSSRLEAARTLSKLSGVESSDAPVGNGFSISINFGDTTATIDGGKVVDGALSSLPLSGLNHKEDTNSGLWGSIDADIVNEDLVFTSGD